MLTLGDIEQPWTVERIRDASLADAAERIREDPSIASDEAALYVEIGVFDEMSALRWLASLELPHAG